MKLNPLEALTHTCRYFPKQVVVDIAARMKAKKLHLASYSALEGDVWDPTRSNFVGAHALHFEHEETHRPFILDAVNGWRHHSLSQYWGKPCWTREYGVNLENKIVIFFDPVQEVAPILDIFEWHTMWPVENWQELAEKEGLQERVIRYASNV